MNKNPKAILSRVVNFLFTRNNEDHYKILHGDESLKKQLESTEYAPELKKRINEMKTPCRISRWALLGIYSVIAVLTGAFYFGWQFLEKMFEESGAYAWLCNADGDFSDLPDPLTGVCIRQKKAIQFLYTIGVLFSNGGAFLSGFALHYWGPRIVGSLGIAMLFIGCTLLAVSNQAIQFYLPAMAIMGAMVEFESLALVSICRFFSNCRATVIAVLMSCVDISWWVPAIMYFVMKTFNLNFSSVFWIYAGSISIPSFIILLFTLPSKNAFSEACEDDVMSQKTCEEAYAMLDEISLLESEEKDIFSEISRNRRASIRELQEEVENTKILSRRYSQEYFIYATPISRARSPSISSLSNIYGLPRLASLKLSPASAPVILPSSLNASASTSQYHQLENDEMSKSDFSQALLPVRFEDNFSKNSIFRRIKQFTIQQKLFLTKFVSPSYFLVATYFGWTTVRLVFFTIAVEDLLGTEFKMILGYIVPFTFVPVLFAGWLMDNAGLFYSLLTNNVMGSSLYVAAYFAFRTNVGLLKWITIIFFVLQNWNYTLLYGSIAIIYGNKEDFGVLVGTACLLSGVLTYFCNFLYSFALVGSNMVIVLIGMNILNAVSFLLQILPCSAKAANVNCNNPL